MAHLFPLFPIFLDLAGRPVTLLSGAPAMARLAARLLDAGAGVRVADPKPSTEMRALAPPVKLIERRWRAIDMRGAALVIAGPEEPRPSRARSSAKAARAVFHMVQAPEESEAVLGDVAVSGPLTVGLAVGDLPPALGAVLRERVEQAAPAALAGFFAAAVRARRAADAALGEGDAQHRFWRSALDAAAKSRPEGPLRDWDAEIAAALKKAGRRR